MNRIICVGELLVDMIGEEDKGLKENSGFSKRPGGAPANVAVAASRLGAEVSMVATVGEDEFGEFLEEKLEAEGVGTENLRRMGEEKTTLAFASLDEQAKPHFSFYRGADEKISAEQLDFNPGSGDIIHVGSLPFTDPETAKGILQFLESVEATVSFDPNLREDLEDKEYSERLKKVVEHVDILTAAEEELEFFGGLEDLRQEIAEIIVTRGEEGAELFTTEDSYFVSSLEVEVEDTTGAGDALTGAYLASRSEGTAKKEALERAVKAASISTTSKGAMSALPEKTELE